MRSVISMAGLLLALQAPVAMACGHCIEDKIAAVYDHAAVTRAVGSSHQVVFFHIDGALAPGSATRRELEAIVESVEGVDRGSVRVSLETTSLAVAFDPRRASLAAVHKALEKKLAARKLSLMLMRVMDSLAELKTVGR
jgi:copper chaperone CopZ